jgi:hypothetical protein
VSLKIYFTCTQKLTQNASKAASQSKTYRTSKTENSNLCYVWIFFYGGGTRVWTLNSGSHTYEAGAQPWAYPSMNLLSRASKAGTVTKKIIKWTSWKLKYFDLQNIFLRKWKDQPLVENISKTYIQ